jgi:hypothetical protein
MRRLMKLFCVLGVLATTAHAQAPPPAPIPHEIRRSAQQLANSALKSDLAYEIVEGLTTEAPQRLSGSPGEAHARAWAEKMLRAQKFDAVRIESFAVPYWARSFDRASVVGPAAQPLTVVALGGSISTPPGGIEAELVAIPSIAALREAKKADIAGKIVFIDEPTIRTQDGSGYGFGVIKRGQCMPLAQALGAAACMVRAAGTHMHRFANQGGPARAPNGAQLPAVAVSPPDAEQLTRLLARGPVRVKLEVGVEVKDDAPSGNVIAEVRGREKPDEIVLIGAHLDSWDQGTGALDDGAGVAIVTAAAKLIQDLKRKPRRTIRVVLFGAEETGIHGAIAYARRHKDDLGKHIVGAESDFGARKVFRFQTRFGEGALGYANAISQQLRPLGIGPHDNRALGGPDMTPLRTAGVPIAELEQNGWDYFDYHHTPDDTLDKIDPAELRQNVAAYAVFAYLAAEMDWDLRALAK